MVGLSTMAYAQPSISVEKLKTECNVCHEVNQGNLKTLYTLPKQQFLQSVQAFQAGARYAPLMSDAVKDLDARTVEALAEYYATHDRP